MAICMVAPAVAQSIASIRGRDRMIPARPHTFVELEHEIFSTVIQSRRAVVK